MSTADALLAPYFPRLDEYCGVWLCEPLAFKTHWHAISRTDIVRHIETAPPRPEPMPFELIKGKGDRNTAVIKLQGMLMKQRPSLGGSSTIDARRQVRTAANDPNVSSILLAVDSPGGTAAGTDELARDVRMASRKKPVWAFVDDLTASAAYWIASQADAIYANSATALVGSIGTLMTVYDISAAAERDGVKAMVFATGPLKGAGVAGTEVTAEQQEYFQGIVNAVQESFDAAVMKGRRLNSSQMAQIRTGAIFPAAKALELNLIDGLRTLDQTIDALSAMR